MRITGLLLALAGWIIVLFALALLKSTAQEAFVLSGLGVEVFGMVLLFRAHFFIRRGTQ
jgi:hypothetical protein